MPVQKSAFTSERKREDHAFHSHAVYNSRSLLLQHILSGTLFQKAQILVEARGAATTHEKDWFPGRPTDRRAACIWTEGASSIVCGCYGWRRPSGRYWDSLL